MSEDFPAQLAGFQPGSQLAGYHLEAQVGAGGMAVVFRARDERLGRLVALKILAPALASDHAFRRRFIAESRAAAAVDDPHIIPVYEAGEADGALFIAMRFVQGGDLRLVLQREGALPPARAAAFISPVASALDAAHAAGLVHRDVKPANILVDARPGHPDHVYLSDFGVSKGATASVSLTGTGVFLGTPDYSAPEQIQGLAVDGRTDQYALACVTYQLLTGSAPFERDQGMAVLFAHLSAPLPSLGTSRPDLPGAADQVLARALAKAPEERYRSCREFADALREALSLAPYIPRGAASAPDHPRTEIAAPLPGFPGPVAAGAGEATAPADRAAAVTMDSPPGGPLVAGAVPLTVTGMAAGVVPAGTATVKPASQPTARRGSPGQSGGLTWIRHHRLAAIALACAVLAAAGSVPFVLAGHPGHPASTANHGSVTISGPIALPGDATEPVDSVAFSPSGTTLAVAGEGFKVPLWSVATKKAAATLTTSIYGVNSVAFSADGGTLAMAQYGSGSTITLWNVATASQTATLTDPHSKGANSVAFSRDGTTLAVGDENGSTYLWNTATRKLTATLPGASGDDAVYSVAFSRDGATLAVGAAGGSIYLWDIATKKLAATLSDPNGQGVGSVAFSAVGTTLAAGDHNGSAYLWDAATKKLAATLSAPHATNISSVAFSPDGTTLAAGDNYANRIYLWDIGTRKLAATLADPNSEGVNSVAFSPDGATLASGDHNGDAYLWRIA